MWVLLIEKAMAKLYGRYGRLNSGEPQHALFDLTGYPTYNYKFYEKEIN